MDDLIIQDTSIMASNEGILTAEALEQAKRQVKLFASLKKVAIQGTIPRDWCDQSGTPYLQASGAEKIAVAFGVQITNQKVEREDYDDEMGKWYLFTATADFSYNRRSLTCDGTGSTRDPFFGKHNVCEKCGGKGFKGVCNDKKCGGKITPQFKRLYEIDIPSVKKKSVTNCHNRGIKKVLGLSFDWEDLQEAGLNIEKITSVERKGKKTAQNNPLTEVHKKSWDALVEMHGSKAAEKLKELTGFQGSNGWVEGKTDIGKISEKQAGFLWGKIKPALDSHRSSNKGSSTKPMREEAPF